MGDQQARRAVNEQVAGAGRARRWLRVAACDAGPGRGAGCSDGCPGCGKTDRLVAWREEQSSRQVFNNKFKVFGMGMVLFAGEFYVNDFAIDGFRCICYKILTSEFCMDLRAVLGTV